MISFRSFCGSQNAASFSEFHVESNPGDEGRAAVAVVAGVDDALEIEREIKATVTDPIGDLGATAIRVDFDAGEVMGRITLWESGACDVEALSFPSDDNLVLRFAHGFGVDGDCGLHERGNF